MPVPKVRIYVRVLLPDGSRPFLDPVMSANRALRGGWAICDGQPRLFEQHVYYLRFFRNGKRVWERIGSDATQALAAKRRTELTLQAAAEGVGVVIEDGRGTISKDELQTGRRSLERCIGEYVAETKEHKSARTFAAYSKTLGLFSESLKPSDRNKAIEDVSRVDLLNFASFLRKQGNAPRTVANRIEYLQIFLHHFGLASLLKGKDKPKFTEKKVRAYNEQELLLMLTQATEDEADLLHFFLATGTREQEAEFACWSDVDLYTKMYTVTEHLDLGYQPKDREEGSIPIAEVLVKRLVARRKRYPKSRLIFPTASGTPDGHLLRIVKRLAFRAGVNCGHCVNKAGKSCADHPVCRHVILHKMRKTYATMLHRNGISARSIMKYLRHSDLETTLRYLADGDDEQTREKINSAFAPFAGGAA